MIIGTYPHKGNINLTQLFGAYYSSIPKKTDGSPRSMIDKARIQLLHQLVTAKLNCAAFSCSVDTQNLINQADYAYAGNNKSSMLSLMSKLDAYNISDGDCFGAD